MPSDNEFSDEKIEKMLEESRMKPVPPQVLKGFKDDVMRRIEAQAPRKPDAGPKPGRWFAGGFRLPRVQMTVGAGAFACLILVSIVALTVDHPAPVAPASKEARAVVAVPGISDGAFQVASVPAVLTAPSQAVSAAAAASVRTSDMMKAAPQLNAPAAARKAVLTVEEELRLIEEFDDQRFFIRQDITEDELASA
jgi:hypothetical protein